MLAFACAAAYAQTVVIQGATVQPDLTSPMVLETPLTAVTPEQLGKWTPVEDLDSYVCDHVSIRRLSVRTLRNKKYVRLYFEVVTFTRGGSDKRVRLDFDLLISGQVVAHEFIPSIDAEESSKGYGFTSLKMPAERWPEDASARLRITVRVTDG